MIDFWGKASLRKRILTAVVVANLVIFLALLGFSLR